MEVWEGRVDSTRDADAMRWHQVVRRPEASSLPGIALLGFACDEGVRRNGGRIGAALGPPALRRALSNLPALGRVPLYDAGDVACESGNLEVAQQHFADCLAALLDAGHFPIGLGGGHEIGFASYLGLAQHRASRAGRLAIVNLDAHFDLRESATPNSGTPFLQAIEHAQRHGIELDYICLGVSESANTARLFRTAEATGTQYLLDRELSVANVDARTTQLAQWLEPAEAIYLSVCLDVLPPSIAGGVSAPSARGVDLEVIESLIAAVIGTGRVRLLDFAELSPPFDRDGTTARVAARLIHQTALAYSRSR
ncbi:formimidoylglutamase [Lysobacter niastensis]|uniref:Formimidoylglutamase n=1 Tax=Lysobacter niastensis TaxID=380629 RepID=A0ABS0B753_9GAMM|nr:formimidoylglutamase [Lysobacter niastensis]MBF6024856.1 formimidoylglutamase [Lysobacter niastensis]